MILWNAQAQQTIQQYFDTIHASQEVWFPFLLLSGPSYVGKTAVVEGHIRKLLWLYIQNDYLPLYDLSDVLWKKHSFKIEVAPKDQSVVVDDHAYIDMWARNVVKWLSLSPTWGYKVVFLENIDRMSIGAANALLKTWEEPLANRIIIATTSNKSALLDTILSRAFVVNFQTVWLQMVTEYIDKRYTEKTPEERSFAASFSLGRIWLARCILDDIATYEESVWWFTTLVDGLQQGTGSIVERYTILQQLAKQASPEQALDAVMYACMHRNIHMWDWIRARNMLASNVNQDNILFDLATR
jgi:hypothetical protein